MHRIDTSTREKDLFGPGKDGFTGGNPLAAKPPTDLSADWFNDVQENIAGVIEGAGIELAKGDGGQLLEGIRRMVNTQALSQTFRREIESAPSASVRGIAFGAGVLAAIGTRSGTIGPSTFATSEDGRLWSPAVPNQYPFPGGRAMVFGNGVFVAIGAVDYVDSYTSSDGQSWTWHGDIGLMGGRDITFGDGLFIAVNELRASTSPDGVTWTAQPSAFTKEAWSITHGAGRFVVVGDAGLSAVSLDGVLWDEYSAPTADSLRGVAYGAGVFVAASESGDVFTSPDGATWSLAHSAGEGFNAVVFGGGVFLALGNGGLMASSFDGSSWTRLPAPEDLPDLYAAAFHEEHRWFAIGGEAASSVIYTTAPLL